MYLDAIPLVKCLPSMQEALSSTPAPCKLGLLVHTYNLSALEVEIGEEFQGHPWLDSEFAATSDTLDCIRKTFFLDLLYSVCHVLLVNKYQSWLLPSELQRDLKKSFF